MGKLSFHTQGKRRTVDLGDHRKLGEAGRMLPDLLVS